MPMESDKLQNVTTDSRYEEFLTLFRSNESRIFGFILAFLPNFAKAEDILQETMIVMWRKFSEFQKDTNFAGWGIQIARYNLYRFHRENKSSIVHFNSEALDNLSLCAKEEQDVNLPSQIDALRLCLDKLESKNKNIMLMKYQENLKTQDICEKVGMSARSMYRHIARIHRVLMKCIHETLYTPDSIQ
jgi:RNA polymerase sigma-70 factor (ECF subfamily)